MNINPEEIYKRLDSVGQQWVEANAKAELLSECQKTELNTLVQEFLPNSKSMAEAESKARADSRYVDYVTRMVEARKSANECKVKYSAAQAWFEGLRTQAATLRQEMRTMDHRT